MATKRKTSTMPAPGMAAAEAAPVAMPMPAPTAGAAEITGENLLTPDEQARMAQIHAQDAMQRADAAAWEQYESRDRSSHILVHRTVDPHEGPLATVIHKWVTITPSLCLEANCGFDAAIAHGFRNGWDSIPEAMVWDGTRTMRQFVAETLVRHTARRHPVGQTNHIRTAEQAARQKAARQLVLPSGFVSNPNV